MRPFADGTRWYSVSSSSRPFSQQLRDFRVRNLVLEPQGLAPRLTLRHTALGCQLLDGAAPGLAQPTLRFSFFPFSRG